MNIYFNTIPVSLPIQVLIVAVKFITGSSEKVVIAISLARIHVNNVAPFSVDTCLVRT